MKNNIKLILIISILFCVNCKPEKPVPKYQIKEFSYNDFPKTQELSGIKHNLNEFLNPRHVLALNDYLIIAENGLDELFYIYRTNDLNFIKKTGKTGMGPNEITMCKSIFPGEKDDEFWAYDSNIKTYSKYSIENSKGLSDKQIKQNEKTLAAIEIAHITDTTFMTKLAEGNEMFVEFSIEGDTINKYGNWKWLLNNDQPDHFNVNILQGRINSSKDKHLFVLSGIIKDYIEVLNRNTEDIVSIRGPYNKNPDYTIETISGYNMPVFKPDVKTIYPQTYIGNNSIFALFYGKPNYDVLGKENVKINIFEFDLKGNPITNYIIDFPIISFSIDEKRRKIFGISMDNEPNIIEFKY